MPYWPWYALQRSTDIETGHARVKPLRGHPSPCRKSAGTVSRPNATFFEFRPSGTLRHPSSFRLRCILCAPRRPLMKSRLLRVLLIVLCAGILGFVVVAAVTNGASNKVPAHVVVNSAPLREKLNEYVT